MCHTVTVYSLDNINHSRINRLDLTGASTPVLDQLIEQNIDSNSGRSTPLGTETSFSVLSEQQKLRKKKSRLAEQISQYVSTMMVLAEFHDETAALETIMLSLNKLGILMFVD